MKILVLQWEEAPYSIQLDTLFLETLEEQVLHFTLQGIRGFWTLQTD